MKLMVEHSEEVQLVLEEVDGKKKYMIEGIFAQAEKPNRNGRNYPKSILSREVNKFQTVIEQKMSIGELSHPQSPQIIPERASHLITSLKMEGNNAMGRAKVLDTPMGKIIKNFLDEGIKLGVSTRGLGSVISKNGINEVQGDYHLVTVDVVSSPSGIDCFVNGVMEGAEWVMDSTGNWKMVEQIKEDIKKISAEEVALKQALYFEQFLKSIK